MKHLSILLILLCIVVLAWAAGGNGVRRSEVPQYTCPTLEQLEIEKLAKEKKDREDKATQRREYIKQKLQVFIDP